MGETRQTASGGEILIQSLVLQGADHVFCVPGESYLDALRDSGIKITAAMHQEREYPNRVVATGLVNPDFAAYARAFGGYGGLVEITDQFKTAFERARASRKPVIIDIRFDPDAISTTSTLSEIRATALKRITEKRLVEAAQ